MICVLIILVSTLLQSQIKRDTILVGYTQAAPFLVQDGENLDGLNIWLWEQAAKNLKLNYKLIPMAFPDMLDSLKTGGIDVSINPLTITSERSKQMEFTHSFFASNATAVVARVSSFEKLVIFLKVYIKKTFQENGEFFKRRDTSNNCCGVGSKKRMSKLHLLTSFTSNCKWVNTYIYPTRF